MGATLRNREGEGVSQIDYYPWRVSSGGGTKRPWWVRRDPVSEPLHLSQSYETKSGALIRFASRAAAQKVADRLNLTQNPVDTHL